MLIIPKLRIPSLIEIHVKDVLVIDALGVRFTDEFEFRKNRIKKIEETFYKAETKDKAEILFFLRECSRTLCMLPSQISPDLGCVPLIKITSIPEAQLNQLAFTCSQNDLALPAFEICEERKYEDLFAIGKALFSVEYRGPIFLVKSGEIETRLRENGVLNSIPVDHTVLTDLTLSSVVESLRALQWYRKRILSASNPWMFAGLSR